MGTRCDQLNASMANDSRRREGQSGVVMSV
jgi:hypothetical protein